MIKISISVEHEDQLTPVSEELKEESSGLRVSQEDLSNMRMNSDLGLYAEITALVLSSAAAAESIFNISDRLKRKNNVTDDKEAKENRKISLTIQKDGTSYEVTSLNADQIRAILEE